MARRKTVIDMSEREWGELSDEQRERALHVKSVIEARVESAEKRALKPKRELPRILAADAEIQAAVVAIRRLTDIRDHTIAEYAKAHPEKANDFTNEVAAATGLSASRVRQLRVIDNIGRQGKRTSTFSDVLTRDFLEREYTEKGRTLESIGKEVSCSAANVGSYMHKYLQEDVESGIPEEKSPFKTRGRGGSRKPKGD